MTLTDKYRNRTPGELLELASSGDAAAFERVVTLTEKAVYNYVLSVTSNREDAEDAVQETYLKLWRNLKNYRSDGSAEGLIMRIARNSALDILRKRHPDEALYYEDENGEESFMQMADDDPDSIPEAAVIRRFETDEVRKAVDELPPRMREIIVMRHISGMKYEDMAEMLNIGIGTVKSRLNRARNMLGQMLKKRNIF